MQVYSHPVTVPAMPRIASHIASYDGHAHIVRATRAAGVMALPLGLLQACNGSDATAPSSTPSSAAPSAYIATATVGSMVVAPIRLTVRGGDGRAARGVHVTWTADNGGFVSESESTTDANGSTVTRWMLGPTAGAQTLVAHVPGLPPVVFSALATPGRAATIRFPTSTSRLALLGDSLRLEPTVLDRFGNAVSEAPVFSVESGTDVVSLTGSTLVARARGTAVIKTMLDTAITRLTLTVNPAAPVVLRVAPDTIVPGATIGIDGQNFASLPEAVDVTIAGVKATVVKATPTHIDAILPFGAVPCQAAATQMMKVAIAGGTSQRAMPLRVATRVALAVGASANMLDAEQVRCTELVAPPGSARAKYVVAVINTSVTAAATSGFELRGAGAGAMTGQNAVARAPTSPVSLLNPSLLVALPGTSAEPSPRLGMPQVSTQERFAEGQHDDFLEAQRALSQRVGSPTPVWRALEAMRAMRGIAAARALSAVGDTVTVKALYSSCTAGRDVRARVVYVGTKALVLEDIASQRAGQLDAQYRQIGDEFDRVQYPLLQSRIGDPLAMDAAMGGDGRVTMLFTRYVNDSLPGIAGYVSACNFYSKGTYAGSNEDEVFYARVPSASESPADWRRTMRSTVIHEAKHLAAFAERFARNTPLEEAWLEESTARIAEELYSRTFAEGGRWKGNVGFSTTVRCEVYQCDDRPLMMWKHFSVLQQYLRGVDTLTPIGAAASGDFTYYASGWSLVRWATDQYASDEGTWLKTLVRGSSATGLANLAQLTGRPVGEMLADWALANAVDDLAGFQPKRPQLTFPSWNTADVNGGLAATYPTSFLAAPLKARAMSFGSFVLPVARLRAFSSSYFSFEGAQLGSQIIELRGENGASVPPGSLRVAVVRVE